jgi:hypothetical protein
MRLQRLRHGIRFGIPAFPALFPAIFGALAAVFLSLTAAPPLAAQTMPPGQWVGDYYYVQTEEGSGKEKKYPYCFIDEDNYVVTPDFYKGFSFNHPKFPGTRPNDRWWFNDGYRDALYVLTSGMVQEGEDGSKYVEYSYLKWQEGEWQFLGAYRNYSVKIVGAYADGEEVADNQLTFFPCDNDRLIVLSWSRDLVDDKRPDRSPFAKMSIKSRGDKKELVVEGSIPFGIDVLQKHISRGPEGRDIFSQPSNGFKIVAGKHAVLIHPLTGLFWCFSLEKATLAKAGSIFKGIDVEETLKTIDKFSLTMAVLCANPEKEGTVLVAALEEAALRGGLASLADVEPENYKIETNPDLTEEQREKINKEREKRFIEQQKKIAKASPYIAWYRIHPENGRVEKLGVPPIGGAHERAGFFSKVWLGMQFWRADEWRPLPDGSVRMGLLEVKNVTKKEEGKDKKK